MQPENHSSETMKETISSSTGRRSAILQILKQSSNISVTELSKKFGVSEVTIRKDLNLLKERNLLVRTRGGAILHETRKDDNDTSIRFKKLANYREKQAIGRAAANLIKDGDTIIIDSGTTALQVACNLHKFRNLTIITNALNVAQEVLAKSTMKLLFNEQNVVVGAVD